MTVSPTTQFSVSFLILDSISKKYLNSHKLSESSFVVFDSFLIEKCFRYCVTNTSNSKCPYADNLRITFSHQMKITQNFSSWCWFSTSSDLNFWNIIFVTGCDLIRKSRLVALIINVILMVLVKEIYLNPELLTLYWARSVAILP